jgi:hypothetical protein
MNCLMKIDWGQDWYQSTHIDKLSYEQVFGLINIALMMPLQHTQPHLPIFKRIKVFFFLKKKILAVQSRLCTFNVTIQIL